MTTPTIVPPYGPADADVLVVGEAPGATEAKRGRPFCGKSGAEQERMVRRNGLSTSSWRMTNVVWEYIEGNPDPTPERLDEWRPRLLQEIIDCRPKVVVTVGRWATRWFFGDWADMATVHGIPQHCGPFPFGERRLSVLAVPVTHPAAGLHDPSARAVIEWDYQQACRVIADVQAGREVRVAYDEYEGNEDYRDVTGKEAQLALSGAALLPLAIDTEGTTDDPWSIQFCQHPAVSYNLRCDQPDFETGIRQLQLTADAGGVIVGHNWMFDLPMCKAMGLDLYAPHVKLVDSMYAAYLLRTEPQSLKALAWRHCGMRMDEYRDVVGDVARDAQIDFLYAVADGDWPKPESRVVTDNAGESKLYTPRPIAKQAEKLLIDVYSKDDVDIADRWKRQDPGQRAVVEASLGPLPTGTLADISLDEAVKYSCRDADATLRLYSALQRRLEEDEIR